MFEMLDALIGLIFIYTILSLMVTTLMEALVQFEGLRGKNLKRAIGRLLADDSRLTQAFYTHQRIQHLQRDARTLPSYIPDDVFILAVVETLTGKSLVELCNRPHLLEESLQRIEKPEIRTTLMQFWDESNGDPGAFKEAVARWFHHTQDRASGWFKKLVRKRLFLLGLLVAVATNADTLHIFQNLLADKSLRDAYVTQAMGLDQKEFDRRMALTGTPPPPAAAGEAESAAQEALADNAIGERLNLMKIASAEMVPVLGWKNAQYSPITPLGWLLTAIALSLGAPFWFDILQKVVKVRSSLRPGSRGGPGGGASSSGKPGVGGAAGGAMAVAGAASSRVDLDAFELFEPQSMNFKRANAFWMVRFAALAYKEELEIQAQCQEWGLESEFYSVESDDADTQFLLAYNRELLILAFRGTEAAKIQDLVTDLNFLPVTCEWNIQLKVHDGFQKALSAAWPKLQERLEVLHQGRYLWIGGHSLGGALAALAASRIAHAARDSRTRLSGLTIGGLYTCGQPRVGDKAFANALEARLGGRYCRIVNNRDIVPTVPPPGLYTHAGTVLYLNETGRLMVDPPLWYRALDKLDYTAGDKERLKARLKETLEDHGSTRYLNLLGKILETLGR